MKALVSKVRGSGKIDSIGYGKKIVDVSGRSTLTIEKSNNKPKRSISSKKAFEKEYRRLLDLYK